MKRRPPGVAERRLLVQGLDLLGVLLAWRLLLWPDSLGDASWPVRVGSLLALTLLWLLAAEGATAYPPEAYGAGRRRPAGSGEGNRGEGAREAGRLPLFLPGPGLVAGLLLLLLHALAATAGLARLPGWTGAGTFLAGFVLLPGLLRAAVRPRLERPGRRVGVLLVGAERSTDGLEALLRSCGSFAYRVAGRVSPEEPADRLLRRIREERIHVVALARSAAAGRLPEGVLARLVERGVEVVPLAALVEGVAGRVPLEADGASGAGAGADPALLPLAPRSLRPLHRASKRALDLLLVFLGLLFFLPVLPLIALAIRLDSPGPVFYTQERVGRGGRLFRLYKFRSMVADAEAAGAPRWAEEDDPRITRVGSFLRGTHLDEFPQMLNILRGEMSPVGPRPERPEFVAELEGRIPHYRMRHAVRPGMAGWSLVELGYASSLEDALRKHEYDLYYVKHRSVWLDLVVLARTVVSAFRLGGR